MQERYSNDEWELLRKLPLAVLGMVAEAEGTMHLRELDRVVAQLDAGAHSQNELHRELMVDVLGSNTARLQQLSQPLSEDDISEITSILHTHLSDEEYQSFVASLFVSGLSVAQGSGPSGGGVGDAEKRVLASFARMFELDPASIQPEVEKLRKSMSRIRVSERLKRMPMFAEVSPEGLERLVTAGMVHTYEPRQTILEEGTLGDSLHLVISGECTVEKLVDKRKHHAMVVAKLHAGDLFGEMGLFEAAVRSASVIATREVTTFSLHRSEFQALLEAEPAAAPSILRSVIVILTQRLRNAEAEMGVLYQVSRIIGHTANMADMGTRVLTTLMDDITTAETGLMAVWRGDAASIVATRNLSQKVSLDRQDPQVLDLEKHNEAFVLNRMGSDHPLYPMLAGDPDGEVVVAPMWVDDQVRGFLAFGCTGGRLNQSQMRVLTVVSNQVATTFARLMEHESVTS